MRPCASELATVNDEVFVADRPPVEEANYRANEPLRRWVQAEPDWSYLELATGHDAMILAPDALSEMLMQE